MIGIMADRLDFERLRGFCDGQTDGQTFAILESLLRLKSIKVPKSQMAKRNSLKQ